MDQRTCIVDGCEGRIRARQRCDSHYRKARQDGSLPLVGGAGYVPEPGKHYLTEFDLGTLRGVCVICGPTAIRPPRSANGGPRCRNRPKRDAPQRKRYNSPRDARLGLKYNLRQSGYDALLAAQGGGCAICHAPPDPVLHVDHDHQTGKVRGLLCRPCNWALGYMRDDPERMWVAINYLAG